MYAIEINNLHKAYSSFPVLRNLSLRVSDGEVYGLLGPHGAGKSTLIHLLLGFLKPSQGTLRVLGMPRPEIARQRVGYVAERIAYHRRYTAREYLLFLGQFSDMQGVPLRRAIEQQLQRVGLADDAERKVSTFSKGMLQRLGIAQALLSGPELLLLDEPLSGLDETEQREVIDVLSDVRSSYHTMLVCTNYVHTLTYLCDRVGVLSHGYLAAETHIRSLRRPGSSVKIHVDQLTPGLRAYLSNMAPSITCSEYTIVIRSNTQQLQNRVLRALLDTGVSVLALEPQEHPLEQFYLRALQPEPWAITAEAPLPSEPAQKPVPTAAPHEPEAARSRSDAPPAATPDDEQQKHALLQSLIQREQQPEQERATPDDRRE